MSVVLPKSIKIHDFIVAMTEGKIQASEYETKHWSQPKGWLKDKSTLKYKQTLTVSDLTQPSYCYAYPEREANILFL